MNLPAFVLITVTSVLVLRSGDRIALDGPPRHENGLVVFRTADGSLFSIASEEIDVAATRAAEARERDPKAAAPKKLKVSPEERDRLLQELSRNRGGTPPPPQQVLEEPPHLQTQEEVRESAREEWEWKREARALEENLTRAEENLQVILERIREFEGRIMGFISLGYRPAQFTYDSSVLEVTKLQVPRAELAIRQAERALAQFKDEARRLGIPPGWLR